MDYETACNMFDGVLPRELRENNFYGSGQKRQHILSHGMIKAQQKYCAEILSSLCTWRRGPYDAVLKYKMLHLLSQALFGARERAVLLVDHLDGSVL